MSNTYAQKAGFYVTNRKKSLKFKVTLDLKTNQNVQKMLKIQK